MWAAVADTVNAAAPGDGFDVTLIAVSLIAAVGSILSVKAGRAAKVEAAATRVSNNSDHGQVANMMTELRKEVLSGFQAIHDEINHLTSRLDDVGHNTGTARDQLMAHQQWHMDHPQPLPDPKDHDG